MDQKLRSVVDQELLEHLTNQIGSKAKSSGNIKQRLWIIGTFISLLVVVMVVVTTNQATNTSKKPSLENDLDYYVYEDYAHSDQDNEYDYDKDYTLIGGNSREDADITKVRPPKILIDSEKKFNSHFSTHGWSVSVRKPLLDGITTAVVQSFLKIPS